ncbi:MAG: hypothetical protein ABIP91_01190 [Sphingomicrobium sp.]
MKPITLDLALALALLSGCSRDDGAPSPADQRELDAAEAMLNEAPATLLDGEPPAANRNEAAD